MGFQWRRDGQLIIVVSVQDVSELALLRRANHTRPTPGVRRHILTRHDASDAAVGGGGEERKIKPRKENREQTKNQICMGEEKRDAK